MPANIGATAIDVVFSSVARARGARALHPRGVVLAGTLHREGLDRPSSVPWLDEPGEDAVLVRFSRGAGLPPPLPDLLGLAIRLTSPAGAACDLLLTSAGRAPGVRHLLRPATHPQRASYTSLVPFNTPSGGLLVGAFPEATGFSLEVAGYRDSWRRFAHLALPEPGSENAEHPDVDFDPVLHPVPGLAQPEWLARLRAPAYGASRRARHRTSQ
ncbi:MAG TPA: hypothetical protein VLL08_33040 [Kineosporiaceae bacterium]|nr:hypothetical protein [Kineosporiaceae bacterium]